MTIDPFTTQILYSIGTGIAGKMGEELLEKRFYIDKLKNFFSNDSKTLKQIDDAAKNQISDSDYFELQKKVNDLIQNQNIRREMVFNNNNTISNTNGENTIIFKPTIINQLDKPTVDIPSENRQGIDSITNRNYPYYYRKLTFNHEQNLHNIDFWLDSDLINYEEYDALNRASLIKCNNEKNEEDYEIDKYIKLDFEKFKKQLNRLFDLGDYEKMEELGESYISNDSFDNYIIYREIGVKYFNISDYNQAMIFYEDAISQLQKIGEIKYKLVWYTFSELLHIYDKLHFDDKIFLLCSEIFSNIHQLDDEQKIDIYTYLEVNSYVSESHTLFFKNKLRELYIKNNSIKDYVLSYIDEASNKFFMNNENAQQIKIQTDKIINDNKNKFSDKKVLKYYLCDYYTFYYMQVEKDYDKCISYFKEKMRLSNKFYKLNIRNKSKLPYISKRLYGNYFSTLAFIEYSFGKFDNALKYSLKSKKWYEKFNDDLNVGGGFQEIGYLNYLLGNSQERDKNTNRALEIFKIYKDHKPYCLIGIYRNIAEFYIKDKNYNLAEQYIKIIIELVNEKNLSDYNDILYFTNKLAMHSDNDEIINHCKSCLDLDHEDFINRVDQYKNYLPIENI